MQAEIESLKKSLAVYRGLVEVSGLIAAITEYDELLQAILEVSRRVMRAEAASLFLLDAEGETLEMALSSYADGEFVRKPVRVPKGKGIAGCVFENGKSLLIRDAYSDSRFYKEVDKQTGFHTRSILCAPLKRDGALIGVLQVLNPREKDAFDAEDLDGFEAYANLTATALEKIRALERSRRQERVERDLAIASEIQTELLSRAIPKQLPEGCAFAALSEPAANVGGDFYAVFVRNPYEIYFGIGDVSGKGMAAALLMAQTISAMQFVFASTSSPADALGKLNATLYNQIVRGMFITALIGRITPSSQRIEIASAGHCRPLLRKASGAVTEIETPGALPLGVLPKVVYQQGKIACQQGDWLVCFTDGLTESRPAHSQDFFEPRIAATLAETPAEPPPKGLIQSLVAAEKLHRGASPRPDDLTILTVGLA